MTPTSPSPGLRVVAVIQARTGSTRLPAKVLMDLGGRSVLAWVVRAAKGSSQVDEVVVATSTALRDDAVARLADSLDVALVRGSEDDVLSRYILAMKESRADAVVRLTADCPLLDPWLIDQAVCLWRSDPSLDYVSTTLVRSFPRGLDVEVVSAGALTDVDAKATGYHRTHVTSLLYSPESDYIQFGLVTSPPANDLRVTLDTAEDLEALRALARILGEDRAPSWRDVVRTLRLHPDVAAMNDRVRQKDLADG